MSYQNQKSNPPRIENIFSPYSFILALKESIDSPLLKKEILIEGIYQISGKQPYNEHYYDRLAEESNKQEVTIMVPESIRRNLKDGDTAKFRCWSFCKQKDGGAIEPILKVIEHLSVTERRLSYRTILSNEIYLQKQQKGTKDLGSLVRSNVRAGRQTTLYLVCGKEAVVDNDVIHALGEQISHYNVQKLRTSFQTEDGLTSYVKELSGRCNPGEVVAFVRGGGDRQDLEVLNSPALCRETINLPAVTLSAIGHQVNTTLLDKVADRSFITPTELGTKLRELVVEENRSILKEHKDKRNRNLLIFVIMLLAIILGIKIGNRYQFF